MMLHLEAFVWRANENCSYKRLCNFWCLCLGREEAVRGSTAPVVGEVDAKEGKHRPRRVAPMRHCSFMRAGIVP
jgi:hypothetical protein